MSIGIDYGGGKTNIDEETGIRYGVIAPNEVAQSWYDSSAPFSVVYCPHCGTVMKDADEYICSACKKRSDPEEMDSGPTSYVLDDGKYKAEQSNEEDDIFICKSPYYTFCEYCSPCAPGAGFIMNPVKGGIKAYCFGHDWFDGGTAPYPVYSIETNKIVPAKKRRKKI